MPNQKVLSEKQAIVADLSEKLKNACAGVLVDYTGTTVATDTEMRRKLREAGVEYMVIKNTLLRFAFNNVGLEALDSSLNGTTAIAISANDPVAAAKVLKEYVDKKDSTVKFKGGFMDGKVLSNEEVTAIGDLPSKEALIAQVLGTLLAPISGLAVAIKAIAEKDTEPAA